MQKLSLKYIFAILTAVMVTAAVVECLRHVAFSDMNVWSGWGQWIGGIGALIAAYAALRISQKESIHRRQQEQRRQFINAHYLTITGTQIKNWGPEPFVNIQVFCSFGEDGDCSEILGVYLPLLLPTGNWNFEALLSANSSEINHFGVQYEDLAGRTWQKLGENLPTEIFKGDKAWRRPPESWASIEPHYSLSS